MRHRASLYELLTWQMAWSYTKLSSSREESFRNYLLVENVKFHVICFVLPFCMARLHRSTFIVSHSIIWNVKVYEDYLCMWNFFTYSDYSEVNEEKFAQRRPRRCRGIQFLLLRVASREFEFSVFISINSAHIFRVRLNCSQFSISSIQIAYQITVTNLDFRFKVSMHTCNLMPLSDRLNFALETWLHSTNEKKSGLNWHVITDSFTPLSPVQSWVKNWSDSEISAHSLSPPQISQNDEERMGKFGI